ncbi:MAG: phage portal protein, partial [Agathobaculum butyriciproducens]
AELVRAICRLEGIAQPKRILQTWTRNMVQNDLETAQIAQQSVGIISDRTILANHPWVDDAENEQKQLEKEQQAAAEKQPQFRFPPKDGAGDGSSG